LRREVLAKKARAASGRSYRTTSHWSLVVNESHAMPANDCPLCQPDAAEIVLWSDTFCRVIWVDDAHYPGFCRVILNAHVKEMTDLPPAERQRLMNVVFAVETAVREIAAAGQDQSGQPGQCGAASALACDSALGDGSEFSRCDLGGVAPASSSSNIGGESQAADSGSDSGFAVGAGITRSCGNTAVNVLPLPTVLSMRSRA
jgi:hypothetical protein